MCLLFESIRIDNGVVRNIAGHACRMNATRRALFGSEVEIDLGRVVAVPEECRAGVWKCRVTYNEEIAGITYEPYTARSVSSLKIIHGDDLVYRYKYVDRSGIAALYGKRGECDDILICKGDLITDTSFSNVAFHDGKRWITPAEPLLKGTRRASLIDSGDIAEGEVRIRDLRLFRTVWLINAMLNPGDVSLTVASIF